jgi:DNA-binding IclR family transcriptional regulator
MSFGLPQTQSELGDALGLSLVHTNRVLQDLRKSNLLSWIAGSSPFGIGPGCSLLLSSTRPISGRNSPSSR